MNYKPLYGPIKSNGLDPHIHFTSFALIFIFFVSVSTNIVGQNYFVDPTFDEPKASKRTMTQCGGNTSETFDANTELYHRVGEGTPDILVPVTEYCPRRPKNTLITSQCLGMLFHCSAYFKHEKYKEPVYTVLNRPLKAGATYTLSFDVLMNTNHYYDMPEVIPYRTSYLSIVLRSTSSIDADTLAIPVPANAFDNWGRAELVFTSTGMYDIVQFDFFSEQFYGPDHKVFMYAFLDNFMLDATTKKPTVFKEIKLNQLTETSRFLYYFDSDASELSRDEEAKLVSNIALLSIQDISRVRVVGYTDVTNTIEYNNSLSSRRARNILKTIKGHIKDTNIEFTAEGKGIDAHQVPQEARRVEVIIEYAKTEVAPWYRTQNNEQHPFNYSFLGNIEIGKRKNGVPLSKQFRKNPAPKFDALPFDAEKMILAKAKKAKVLIINEAHSSPEHRVFISALLPKLWKLGYHKLAVEALQKDNDPHSLTIKDPVFLRYLSDAQNQGYALLSYDNKTNTEPNWADIKTMEGVEYAEGYEHISKNMNIRDYNQFLNLEDEIDKLSSQEKMIIHVGHGHGGKVQIGEWKPLGAYLSDKYGSASVLSIDQVALNDCVTLDSNDFYNQYHPTKSIVCSSGSKPYCEQEFNPLSMTFECVSDLQVLHPKVEVKLRVDTTHIFVRHMDLLAAAYPLAILVYEANANPRTAVAYSAIEVRHQEDLKPSIVPNSGGYGLLIKDAKNAVLSWKVYRE